MSVLIETKSLWLAETNCYVVAAERGGPCVIVDAPPDVPAIEALVAANDLAPVALLVTHGHIDHAGGGAVAAVYDIDAYLHPDDEFLALDPASQLRLLFGTAPPRAGRPILLSGRLHIPGGRAAARAGRSRVGRHPHPGAHAWSLLLLPRLRRRVVLRRPALRRLHRPHRPSGRRLRHPHEVDAGATC